jgi:hypothetical protein
MLELLDGEVDREEIVDAIGGFARRAEAARDQGDHRLVARVEAEVAADPATAIVVGTDGHATLHARGQRWRAGRFEVLPIGTLRTRAMSARDAAGRPAAGRRLWVLDGSSPAKDIGALQATAAAGSLFQVASQFNCLEAPSPEVVPIAAYLHDSTQGPRASISAFPGTFVRHYAAPGPDGQRFTQEHDGRQLDLLANVCDPGVARVRNGYLRARDIRDPARLARAVGERFDAIAVGVHDGIDVVLGADWFGKVDDAPYRTIAQVFTSTLDAGGGGLPDEPHGRAIVRQLQRAAYLGTLLAAAALGARRVGLTLIGGGVFANPIELIWDAIVWASDAIVPYLHAELSIVVNGFSIGRELPVSDLVAAARERGGAMIQFDRSGARFVG